MKREMSSGTLSFDGSGRLLLIRPAGRRKWAIPKGHIEKGETATQAACRETYEETGVTVRIAQCLPGFALDNKFCHKDVCVFIATIEGGTPRPDGIETEEIGFFSLDDPPEMIQSQASWFASVLPTLRSFVIEQVTHETCADVAQHIDRIPVVKQDEAPVGCDTPSALACRRQ